MKSGETNRDELFLKIALEKNYISAEQAAACREDQNKFEKMGYSRSLIQIASEKEIIDLAQAREIRREMQKRGILPRIGGYELLAKLGQGGMGAVYKARQISLDRIVALKVLSPELARDKAYVERFRREGLMAARITHPNAVQIIDVGESGGRYYMVMEYVEGSSSDKLLANGPISERKALSITRGALEALSVAHQSNIIHRDIKPANILVSKEGRPKLADLGIARQFGVQGGTLTGTGAAIGTPHYMSPEQCKGDKEIDGRADIYSLGATLYHFLCGKPPFIGSKTNVAIMYAQTYEPPPDPREANRKLSPGVSALVQRMMAKDRDARPADCAAVIEEIDRLERGEKPQFVAAEGASPTPPPTEAGSSFYTPMATPQGAFATLKKSRKIKIGLGVSAPATLLLIIMIAALAGGKGVESTNQLEADSLDGYEARLAEVEAARQSRLLADYEDKWREMERYHRDGKWEDALVALGELRSLGLHLDAKPRSFVLIEERMNRARSMIRASAEGDSGESEPHEPSDIIEEKPVVADDEPDAPVLAELEVDEYPAILQEVIELIREGESDAIAGRRFELGGYAFKVLGEAVSPQDINNRGEVVGSFLKGEDRTSIAFYYSPESGFRELGTLPAPFNVNSSATAVNESGLAMGRSNGDDNASNVYIWSRDRGMRGISDLRGERIVPRDMCDSGRIIGALTSRDRSHAFLYIPGGRNIYLGEDHVPHAINNEGLIVGVGEGQAVLWARDNRPEYLGGLPDAETSWASDINDDGVVVGVSILRGSIQRNDRPTGMQMVRLPFIWTREEGIASLSVPDNFIGGVVKVNNRGQVLVSGMFRDFDARYEYMEKRRAGKIPPGTPPPLITVPASYIFEGDRRIELPALEGHDSFTYRSINDKGQLAGAMRIRVDNRSVSFGVIAAPIE